MCAWMVALAVVPKLALPLRSTGSLRRARSRLFCPGDSVHVGPYPAGSRA